MFDHLANSTPTSGSNQTLPDYRIRFGNITSTEPDSTKASEKPADEAELAWQSYKHQPDKIRLRQVAAAIQPTIDKALNSYAGQSVPPTLRDRARLMAIEAIERYKPAEGTGGLHAYVMTTLRGLQRSAAKITQPMAPPADARQRNAEYISAIQQLSNDLGREPSDEEIQDKLNVPLKQVMKLRRRVRAQVPLSMWEAKFEDEDGEGGDIVASQRQPYDDWMDAVYSDLGALDRLIMQYRSGYRKSPVLSNQEIARKLNMSPVGVSNRARAIQERLDEFNG
jgi:DNA-directed RNA polymerase specialized sigma subunit